MSTADLSNFIKALEVVKQDYTCGVCSQLCKEPVTLSKCFHIICAEHFEGLKTCPTCEISLEGCSTYVDKRLGSCIDSTKVLDQMFEKYKGTVKSQTNTSSGGKKRGKQTGKTDKSTEKDENNATLKETQPKAIKRTRQKIEQTSVTEEDSSKENTSKPNPIVKPEKNKAEKPNVSAASSKINKTVEKRNTKGETMLHIACRLGKIDKITELLNQGANTNSKDNAGWTPLHEVVQNGRLDLVKLLLQYNTLINVPGQSNETPLHEAVRYNHADIAEELVKNGADINAKNCKGETPLELATENMKAIIVNAAENIIQTQSLNVTLISELYSELDSDDIRVFCVSEFRTVHNKLKALAKHHTNLNVEPKFTKKVTHLIVDSEDDGVCQSSVDVLQGIVSGLWILSSNWITKSNEKKLEPFTSYEVTGVGAKTYNGPKNARYNKYKQFPGIFNGCHFYLHNFNTKYEISKNIILTKAVLTKLITDAGGVVLRRTPNPESIPDSEKLIPYHAKKDGKLVKCSHYIIFKDLYEPMYNMQHLKALPIGWLIECIEKYELCEPW